MTDMTELMTLEDWIERHRQTFRETFEKILTELAASLGIAADLEFYEEFEPDEIGAGAVFKAGSNHDHEEALILAFSVRHAPERIGEEVELKPIRNGIQRRTERVSIPEGIERIANLLRNEAVGLSRT